MDKKKFNLMAGKGFIKTSTLKENKMDATEKRVHQPQLTLQEQNKQE